MKRYRCTSFIYVYFILHLCDHFLHQSYKSVTYIQLILARALSLIKGWNLEELHILIVSHFKALRLLIISVWRLIWIVVAESIQITLTSVIKRRSPINNKKLVSFKNISTNTFNKAFVIFLMFIIERLCLN